MTELDGIKITEAMKEELRVWQEDKCCVLDIDIETISDAICIIAREHECPDLNNEKEALSIISNLSFLRKKLKHFGNLL